jgi:hypothetical protein
LATRENVTPEPVYHLSKKAVFARKTLNAEWEKTNAEDIKKIEDILANYRKKRDGKNEYLVKSLQSLKLIETFDEIPCRICRSCCTVRKDFDLCHPEVRCTCGKSRVDIKDGTIFELSPRSLIDQLQFIKGIMVKETSYAVAKSTGYSESSVRGYSNLANTRLHWYVGKQTENYLKNLLPAVINEAEFYVDQFPVYINKKEDDSEYILVAAIIEGTTRKAFFKVLEKEGSSYFDWIKEFVPKKFFSRLEFLSSNFTGEQKIRKTFPEASFTEKTCKRSAITELQSLHSLIQELFDLNWNGKNEFNLQRNIEAVLFQFNGFNSYLEFFRVGNEAIYKASLKSSNQSCEQADAKVIYSFPRLLIYLFSVF